ncbi:MAG: dihydropteroate synthase [Burkholderiaceae bacterium]
MAEATVLRCGRFVLDLARPRVMGIVNLTPDSFSDGGRLGDASAAIRHAERLMEEGADVIDLGAESTRPGATPVSADIEVARLMPVLTALRDAPVPISVDTMEAEVMAQAFDAGASMINDVTGFASNASREAVRASDCALCVMHMQGTPQTMQVAPHYDDVVAEVSHHLRERCDALIAEGISRERLVIDPGFGFGKALEHNLSLLCRLGELGSLGLPILVGLSRKGMIGQITGRPLTERLAGSLAAALVAIENGARIVRVHDVAATVDAIKVWMSTRTATR